MMKLEIIILLCLIGATISGFLIGFGLRGVLESEINAKVKGYINWWNRKKEGRRR